MTYSHYCQEPTTASGGVSNDWYSVNLKKERQGIIIEMINKNRIIHKFQVLSINKSKTLGQKNILTFVRQEL